MKWIEVENGYESEDGKYRCIENTFPGYTWKVGKRRYAGRYTYIGCFGKLEEAQKALELGYFEYNDK